ncbi:hypothetical protein HZS_5689 [Henneguya salminicola]|nr:hypothetical protein HZS_5689 [Henneguya salminicola]
MIGLIIRISIKSVSETLNNISIRTHTDWKVLCLDYYPYISKISKADSYNSLNGRNIKFIF